MWNSINSIISYGVIFNSTRMLIGATSAMFLLANGISLIELGILKTLQAVIILLLDIPLAYFADRYSKKLSITLGVISGGIWLILTGLAQSNEIFYVAEVFNALSMVFIGGAFMAYLVNSAKRLSDSDNTIHNVLSKYQKIQFIAMGIAALIGSFLFSIESKQIWLIAGGTSLALALLGVLLLPKDRDNEDLAHNKNSFVEDLSNIRIGLKTLKANSPSLIIYMLTIASIFQVLIQYWQPIASPTQELIAANLGLIFAGILGVQSFASYLAEKLKTSEATLKMGQVLNVIVLVCTIFVVKFWPEMIFISIILLFLVNRLINIALQSKFHEVIESQFRSTYDSVFSTGLRIILIVVMPFTGWALAHLGSNILFIFLILPVFFLLSSFRRKDV